MLNNATVLEPQDAEIASLYDDYLTERELAASVTDRLLPEFYAPAPTPLTLTVR